MAQGLSTANSNSDAHSTKPSAANSHPGTIPSEMTSCPRTCGVLGFEFFSPLSVSRDPIHALLAVSGEEGDRLAMKWLEAKNQELAYVGITSAIIASLFSSAFAWPAADSAPWFAQACWYGGLIFILSSIATATQQGIMLHRFSCYTDCGRRVRYMLGYHNKHGRMRKRSFQLFVWQIPVMNLRFGVYMFLAGLFIMLWHKAMKTSDKTSPESKTAIMFSVIVVVAFVCHGFSVIFGYSRVRLAGRPDDEFEGQDEIEAREAATV